jgi:hypothetical protein
VTSGIFCFRHAFAHQPHLRSSLHDNDVGSAVIDDLNSVNGVMKELLSVLAA